MLLYPVTPWHHLSGKVTLAGDLGGDSDSGPLVFATRSGNPVGYNI